MYLKKLSIEHFRKFGDANNTIQFAASKDYKAEKYLNIAPKTTLIVGKNNSGKTTIVEVLRRLLEQTDFRATDFNFDYLQTLLISYTPRRLKNGKIKFPTMKFVLTIGIDNDDPDLLTNIAPFITLGEVKNSEVIIKAVWSPADEELFLKKLSQFVESKRHYKNQLFSHFLSFIDTCKFALTYYNNNDEKREGFHLKQLIELQAIAANTVTNGDCLSSAFSKIVDYRYEHIKDENPFSELDKEIVTINEKLTGYFDKEHTSYVNNSLAKLISSEKCKILLSSDLTFQKLLKSVLKYQYVEGDKNIPENQFGLGYTNLMMIVANIIGYMEKFPETSFNSQINLITIEEPETFMHPQMQELFIRDVNVMIGALLEGHNKHVNSQIIITTHSAHILNSKIHEGNSFNSINYVTENNNCTCAIILDDQTIIPKKENEAEEDEKKRLAQLQYIKKHITFGISQLFFADAAIFVEGISEYVLLQQYMSEHDLLKQKYVTLNLVNGAFAQVYRPLISALHIPVLIITDIDFKREKQERKDRIQMTEAALSNRETTNTALAEYYGTKIASQIVKSNYFQERNLMVTCQKAEIQGYYATSFEEALILTNSNNEVIKQVIKELKPQVYQECMEDGGLAEHSYRIQRSLAQDKSDFANRLVYDIIIGTNDAKEIKLPQYIIDGIDFVVRRLEAI